MTNKTVKTTTKAKKPQPTVAPRPRAVHKKFQGVVVSDKMEKTLVVKVERIKLHPKYHKRYVVSRNYKVHDESGLYHTGDWVSFVECRPLSKEKRWRVVKDNR